MSTIIVPMHEETPSPDLTSGSITTILVGPRQRRYTVAKDVLCKKLGYFRSAYETNQQNENLFRIDDVPDVVFRAFIAWLYTGDITLDPHTDTAVSDATDVAVDSRPEHSDLEAQSKIREDDDTMAELMDEDEEDDEDDEDDEDGDMSSDEDSGVLAGSDDTSMMSDDDHDSEVDDLEDFLEASRKDKAMRKGAAPLLMMSDGTVSPIDVAARQIFPGSETSMLDAYQLQVLISVYGERAEPQLAHCVLYWQQLLEEKLDAEQGGVASRVNKQEQQRQKQLFDAYDRLVKLFILAERLDSPELRGRLAVALKQEYADRNASGVVHTVPTFETVVKAYKHTSGSSWLRSWLVRIFSSKWSPRLDTPEQVLARQQLSFDFVLDVAIYMADHAPSARMRTKLPILWLFVILRFGMVQEATQARRGRSDD